MSLPIRSYQRIAATIPAVIFGPLFMLGPIVVAVCILVYAQLSAITVLGALALVFASAFITYHMTQNFHWVEFDGTTIRGQKFWTRQIVENTLDNVRDIRVLSALGKGAVSSITDELIGSVRGYEIRFHQGKSIYLVRLDMANADKLAAAVEQALENRA